MTNAADLVLTGTPIWVGDATTTDALAVRDGAVVALGDEHVRSLIGPRTEVLDRPGGLVVPGFQDCHVHAPPAARELLTIDLHELADGRPAYLGRIAEYCSANPDAEWITGGGWALDHFPGSGPRKEDLDAITGARPAFLFNRDVHGAWVNSAALELAGIDASTPDPSDGYFERDPDGTPTGMLHEGAAYTFNERWVPAPTHEQWEQAVLHAQHYLYSLGITGWQDAWVTPQTFAAYRSLGADGRLTANVVGALWWDRHRGLEQIDEFRQRRAEVADNAGAFHPSAVKIMVDGIIENQTASMLQPYCTDCNSHADADNLGLDYVPRELLIAAVTELDSLGFQVHMHAIGDRAVRNALDAVEAAQQTNGRSDRRHHIAHLQVIQPADLARFGPLGVVANCQTYWAQHEPQMDELTVPNIGAERGALQYPFEGLRRAGARLAMGSDWPVTTPDPLQQLEVAVRRIDPEHRDNAPFLPTERLRLDDALTAFTSGSAYLNHDDAGGTLEVGKRADFAVLDQDVFTLDGRLADAAVVTTVASGSVVYRSGG